MLMNNKFKAHTVTGNPSGNYHCQLSALRTLNISRSFSQSACSIESRCVVRSPCSQQCELWAGWPSKSFKHSCYFTWKIMICTFHDRSAVMIYAKLRSYYIIIMIIAAKKTFMELQLWVHKVFCFVKWVPVYVIYHQNSTIWVYSSVLTWKSY